MNISIVTASWNQGRYVREALESVRAQGHREVEHLVLDGGSTDETVPLLRYLDGQERWKHLQWRSRPDGGQSEALNDGLDQVSGNIVGWLNCDDRYRAGCFDHIVRAFAENPEVDVFYGDFAAVDGQGDVLRVHREIEFNRFILLYHRVSYIPTPATFFRRRVFDDGNRLRPDLHYAMDYEFFLRLADAGYTIRHIPHVLADFRLHPESKSCSKSLEQAREKRQIMCSISPVSRWTASRSLRSALFAVAQLLAGLMRYAEKALRGCYFNKPIWRTEEMPPAD